MGYVGASALAEQPQSPDVPVSLSEDFIRETHKDQIAALRAIVLEVKTHYGMAKFKEEQFGITLPALEEKYTRLIMSAQLLEEAAGLVPKVKRDVLSHTEFQQLMIGFAAEFKDGHFNILRESREAWSLGIRTAAIGGRLYIVGFNGNLFDPATVYPRLEVGDEVLSRGWRERPGDRAPQRALYSFGDTGIAQAVGAGNGAQRLAPVHAQEAGRG